MQRLRVRATVNRVLATRQPGPRQPGPRRGGEVIFFNVGIARADERDFLARNIDGRTSVIEIVPARGSESFGEFEPRDIPDWTIGGSKTSRARQLARGVLSLRAEVVIGAHITGTGPHQKWRESVKNGRQRVGMPHVVAGINH